MPTGECARQHAQASSRHAWTDALRSRANAGQASETRQLLGLRAVDTSQRPRFPATSSSARSCASAPGGSHGGLSTVSLAAHARGNAGTAKARFCCTLNTEGAATGPLYTQTSVELRRTGLAGCWARRGSAGRRSARRTAWHAPTRLNATGVHATPDDEMPRAAQATPWHAHARAHVRLGASKPPRPRRACGNPCSGAAAACGGHAHLRCSCSCRQQPRTAHPHCRCARQGSMARAVRSSEGGGDSLCHPAAWR